LQDPIKLGWVVTLRGVAALWVFAYHLWLSMGGNSFRFGLPTDFSFGLRSIFRAGYEGVDLFFVLSGFVIAWPYVARAGGGKASLDRYEVADFYQRRYLRIAPVYYVSLFAAVVLIAGGLLPGRVHAGAIASHLAFAENFNPQWVTSIRGVYWTLPTEIGFYLLFPVLLRFTNLDRPLRMACCVILFAIAYRYLVVWLTVKHGVWTTWTAAYLPGRIDQFGCGMAAACAVAAARRNATKVSKSTVLLLGMLAIACLVLVSRNASDQFDMWYMTGASLSAVSIALFIGSMGVWANTRRSPPSTAATWGASRMLYVLGEASLSIYLWHTFFIDLILVAALRWGWTPETKMGMLFTTIPITLIVSLVTYRFIEAPAVAMSKSPKWRWRIARLVDHATAIFHHAPVGLASAAPRKDERSAG
jgi:peptidoglycan/LPS O-acetylase OafA/YrhL